MNHFEIWKEKDRYCSFPHIIKLPNGNLMTTFRKASKFSSDSAKKGVATHHDPDSSIEIIESTDSGETWDKSTRRTAYKSNYGVNDPSLTLLSNGKLLLRFVALNIEDDYNKIENRKIFSHRSEHGLVTNVLGNLILESTDMGKTWDELSMANSDIIGPSCSRDPIIELPDQSLLLPVYTGAPQRTDISWVIRSFDGGKTWIEPIRIMSDENGRFSQLHGINYNETSLLYLGNGEILAMVRSDEAFHTENEFMPVGGIGKINAAKSFDSGLCWTKPKDVGIWGQPGSVIKLKSGKLLCTYGYRKKPFGIRACISRNNGSDWDIDNEIIIRDDSPTWDCGYPFSVELNDNEIYTVYYIVDDEGTRFVSGTKWTLND